MSKEYMHIEIVRSTTPALNSMSQTSCDAIYKVLSKRFTNVGVTIINSPDDLETLLNSAPDLVFLGMEFVPSDPLMGKYDPNKIWISDFLDDHGIAATGSSARAYELQRNKGSAKQRVLDAGLNTSAFHIVTMGEDFKESDLKLPFPLFVKPLALGGGLGVDSESVVHNYNQLQKRINYIACDLNSGSLIERYLPGREFSVAIFKDSLSEEYLTLPVELIAPVNEFGAQLLSQQIKSSNSDQAIEVAEPELKTLLGDFGLDVFLALGARDYGRIDIRLDEDGIAQFLEANLIPSLISGYGSFPRACVINLGLEYEDMINQIVDLAILRQNKLMEIIDNDQDMEDDAIYPTADIALKPI